MEFEWDPKKQGINLAKHGVDFDDVNRVFDSFTVVEIDDRLVYGEVRFRAIGLLDDLVIFVMFTDRQVEGSGVRRIISARRASRHERKKFFEAKAREDRLGTPSEYD